MTTAADGAEAELAGSTEEASAPAAERRRLGLHWWGEVLFIVAFYLVYSFVRNTFGSNAGTGRIAAETAFEHAETMIDLQDAIGLWIEPELQRWFLDLPARGGIRVWNIFYGTAHFVVTAVALLALFVRAPRRYPAWRNTLAAMTALALVGFASYSLMPPRLLDDTSIYGACFGQAEGCHGYGMVDTLARYGGLWSFDSGAMAEVSNQYAAMPSLHTGWSLWCAFVLWPMARRRWTKALVALYPALTVFGIMITANHYWIDAVGGAAVFGAAWPIGSRLAALTRARRQRRQLSHGGRGGQPVLADHATGGP